MREHDAECHRRPARRDLERASCSTSPRTRAHMSGTSCGTRRRRPCRARSRRHSRATDADNAITRIHDLAFRAAHPRDGRARRRDARWRRHLDHAAPGADALRVRRARQRRLPQGDGGVHADLRPPGMAARSTARGPASRCWSTRSGSTNSATLVEDELRGDWVKERDYSLDADRVRARRGGERPGAANRPFEPQRRPPRIRPVPRHQRAAPSGRGVSPQSRSRSGAAT